MKPTVQKSSRDLSFDVIRIIAVSMVLMLHTSCCLVLAYTDPASAEFTVGNIFNGISRAGVPLFVMLTGALLLDEKKHFDAKTFYKKSFLPMVLLLVGWILFYGAFYAFLLPSIKGDAIDVNVFWNYLMDQPVNYPHLWYMFMCVGIYLAIPVLRLFVKEKNKNYILGIIIAFAIVQCFSSSAAFFTDGWAMDFNSFFAKFHLGPLKGYWGYLFVGWYLSTFTFKKATRIRIYIVGLISIILAIVGVYNFISQSASVYTYLYDPLTILIFFYASALFLFIQSICKKKQTQSKFLITISKCSFGAYIMHVVWIELFAYWVPYWTFPIQIPLLYLVLLFLAVSGASFLTVWLVSLIKPLKAIFHIH